MASPLWSGCLPHSSTGENRSLALQKAFRISLVGAENRPVVAWYCSSFSAFLGLQSVHLAWMTLKKYSEDGLKNRKLQIPFGQQSLKTKYRSQGKEKKKRRGFLSLTKPSGHGKHPSSESSWANLPLQEGSLRSATDRKSVNMTLRAWMWRARRVQGNSIAPPVWLTLLSLSTSSSRMDT